MVPNLSHYVRRLLDEFRSASTDSRLLILQDAENVLNGFNDVHTAIQFNLAFTLYTNSSVNLVDYLLDLITTSLEDGEDATTALALGGTLGAICRAGIRVKNLKQILKCLKGDESGDRSVKKGSKAQCRLSMLRALEVMAQPLIETPLSCFFNFSGPGAVLFIPHISWPFQSACQVLLWFRVEEFSSDESRSHDGDSSTCPSRGPSILSFTTGEGIVMEYFLEDNCLCVMTPVACNKGANSTTSMKTNVMGNTTLEKRKWYSLVLQHSRPRSLYSATSVDQIRNMTFDGPVQLSRQVSSKSFVNARIGKDLQGQISGVFLDAYNDEEAVAFERLDSFKSCYSFSTLNALSNRFKEGKKLEKGLNFLDITQSVENVWRGGQKKALAAYMPYHSEGGIVRELVSGWHAIYGPNACTWVDHHPREIVGCLGGIGVLLPLLGPSCSPLDQLVFYENYSQGRHRQRGPTSGNVVRNNWLPLAQVLLVFASFLSGHKTNQSDFIRLWGLEWMEAAIAARPASSFLNSIGTSDDEADEAKRLAMAVEHFCWSCAPVGSIAWKSSIIRLLGTMRIWGEAPSCLRTALLLSFERVTTNVGHVLPFQDGWVLPKNTITFSLSPTSLLEALALSCPPISSAHDCVDLFQDEREAVLRILAPMVISTPQNGVELASRALICSATTLANDSIAFMGSLFSLLHMVFRNVSIREEAMSKLIATTSKVVKADDTEVCLTGKEAQFALLCHLFRCCSLHNNGANTVGDEEQLKATFINVVGDCRMTSSAFFEPDKLVHVIIPYLRRLFVVPFLVPSSPSSIDKEELDTKQQVDDDVRGSACEELASFIFVDSSLDGFYSPEWLSLVMESMLCTSLSACSNTLLIMKEYICGGKGTAINNHHQQLNHYPRFGGGHSPVNDDSDVPSLYSSWLWQRHMVKIHVYLLTESNVKYEAAFFTSTEIHAKILSSTISHSNWGEEVELLLELVLRENEPSAKRAAILVLINLTEEVEGGEWFVHRRLPLPSEFNSGNVRRQLTSSIPQTLRLSEDQLFDNVPPSTGSYHSTERIMKGVENVLKRKMDILAISLLQLSVLVLAEASIEDNPMWVLLNGKRIASVYRQVAMLLSQRADQDEEESQEPVIICIVPFILSTSNSGLVQLSKRVIRMKESSPSSSIESNDNDTYRHSPLCIEAALVLSDGLKRATDEALGMLERSVEAGVCKVSDTMLIALRAAIVESTTAPLPGTGSGTNAAIDNNGGIFSWDTACQSLEWVRCSRYFNAEISAELKSHAQDILSSIRVDQTEVEEGPYSRFRRMGSNRSSTDDDVQCQRHNLVNENSFKGMVLCLRCEAEDIELEKGSEQTIASVEMKAAIMKDGLERLEQTMRLTAQCNEDLTWELARRQWDGFIRNCIEEWSPWAPSGPVSYRLSRGEGKQMLQMLLMPSNIDVDYADTAYDEGDTLASLATDASELDISGVKPLSPITSENALKNLDISYGEVREDTGIDDDDEETSINIEETGGGGERSSAAPLELMPLDSEADGWEEITVGIAQAAEWEVVMETQLAVQLGGKGGSITGRWKVLIVLAGRHVAGTLFLSKKNVVFRSFSTHRGSIDSSISKTGRSYASCSPSDYQLQQWCLSHLQGIFLRRYMLDVRAVELVLVKADGWCPSRDVFLAFDSVSEMQSFVNALQKLSYKGTFPLFTWPKSLRPASVIRTSHLTEAWKRRQISNFDYLMCLNFIAGRSYNDMTQYPVMPWVLADYESSELDLSESSTFRDLSKPVGALDERRLNAFHERYESFLDPMIPHFLYGSHYSSPGITLYFLVRQEPYTSMHVKLQGGRFDCPDRLFFDMNQCWRNCLSSMSDVKELIPELFCCPDVFSNSRCLQLGTLQDGSGRVNDVRLPPWASGSPHKFVRLHRLALESEKVSCNLHKWIDLVFGHKQSGEAALKSNNIFYYLTYEGAVNVGSITDRVQREAVEAQVAHFGQTPSQLFVDPHPSRLPLEDCVPPCFSVPSRLQVFCPRRQPGGRGELGPVLSVCCNSRRVVVVHAKDLTVTSYAWTSLPDGEGLPFSLKLERSCALSCAPFFVHKAVSDNDPFEVPQGIQNGGGCDSVSSQLPMASKFALVSSFMEGSNWLGGMATTPPVSSTHVTDCLVSCDYWDGCLKVHSLNTTGIGSSGWDCLSSTRGLHIGRITCLASGWDGGECIVATGGEDTLVCLWRFSCGRMCTALVEDDRVGREMSVGSPPSAKSGAIGQQQRLLAGLEIENSLRCMLRLYGHDAPITCLAICGDVGLIASGAADGRIALHTLRSGSYIRTLWLPSSSSSSSNVYHHPSPHLLCLTQHGDVIAHSREDFSLHLLTVNGAHVTSVTTPGVMKSIVSTADGESIVCSHTVKGEVVSRSLLDLRVEHTVVPVLAHDAPISTPPTHIMDIHLSPRDGFLLIGLESGEIMIATDVKTRLSMIHTAFKSMYL